MTPINLSTVGADILKDYVIFLNLLEREIDIYPWKTGDLLAFMMFWYFTIK